MSQSLNLKIKGLFTSFNNLSEVPEGALSEATNIDIYQDSVAQPRRGFDRYTDGLTTSSWRYKALVEYDTVIHAHHTNAGNGALSYLDSFTEAWTFLASVEPPTGNTMRFLQANRNLYMTSNLGLKKIDEVTTVPVDAGAYKGLDLTASTSASASTWLTATSSVAYRAVWGYKDANDNLILGAPSQREVYTSVGAGSVDLTITIPDGVTTSWFVQLYRSATVASTVTPNDELGLVYEINPTAGEITAKSLVITDIVPPELRGATIYTAGTQEGLAMGNEQPPMAQDIAVFRDCIFYGYTESKHRFFLTLVAVDTPNGIVANDTVTIDGIVYTAKATENVANREFAVYTAGSAAVDIRETALSLVRVINRATTSTVYAYYLSGPDDLPGKILLEDRALGGSEFPVLSSRATCWSPTDIASSGTNNLSTNDSFPNGLAWSKPNQPESVPLANFVQVGSRNRGIQRIVSLRDGLYVFKKDEGVYKVSGYYPNFQVDKIDDSINLVSQDSVQVLNNQIFCLTDQGVVILTDSVKVISQPIEEDLLRIINDGNMQANGGCFGLAYESDRKYCLYLREAGTSGNSAPTFSLVYNLFTNAWVRHDVGATCGLISLSRKMHLGDNDSHYLLRERKTYTYTDHVDYGFETTIATISDETITVGSLFDSLEVGDILWQSSSLFATVETLDPANQTLTIDSNPGFTVAAATVYKAISTGITWVPVAFANPGIQKQFHTAVVVFDAEFSGSATLGFATDLSQDEEMVTLTGRDIGLWGMFPWGEAPWGGEVLKRPIRQWIPRAKQRASQITVSFRHTSGFSPWKLLGLSLFGEEGSEKVAK